MIRAGIGYDVHRLVKGRRLILGGVHIPYEWGLEGHSDADVLVHAIMDAILGAIGKGDIGIHFPDSDPRYKDADSIRLLTKVMDLADKNGYKVNNLDSIIVAQRPRLSPYIPRMRKNISNALRIDESRVNIKATTTEGLGFEGRGEGISAYAVVALIKKDG